MHDKNTLAGGSRRLFLVASAQALGTKNNVINLSSCILLWLGLVLAVHMHDMITLMECCQRRSLVESDLAVG